MKEYSIIAMLAVAVAGQSPLAIFTSLPQCGQSCLAPLLGVLNCNLTTLPQLGQCLCPNVQAERNISSCVQATCTPAEQFVISDANHLLCAGFLVPSRSQELKVTIIALSAITLPLIILRIFSRSVITKLIWWDDVMMLVCGLLLIGVLVVEMLSVEKGLGKHLWNIDLREATALAKLFYTSQLFYIVIQELAKISILIFYLRVFPQRWFRISVYATGAWAILHGLIFLLVTAFQCLPVKSVWDKNSTGKCVNQEALIYAGAAFSIIEDFLILALPIPCISSLRLSRLKKFGVGLMFSIGSFSCITSIVRLKFIKGFGDFTDATWDNVDTTIWSEIEIFTAAICACLPAVRQLLQRTFPKILDSRDGSSGKSDHSTSKHPERSFVSQEASKAMSGSQNPHSTTKRSILGTERGASGRRLSEDSDTVELVDV